MCFILFCSVEKVFDEKCSMTCVIRVLSCQSCRRSEIVTHLHLCNLQAFVSLSDVIREIPKVVSISWFRKCQYIENEMEIIN